MNIQDLIAAFCTNENKKKILNLDRYYTLKMSLASRWHYIICSGTDDGEMDVWGVAEG